MATSLRRLLSRKSLLLGGVLVVAGVLALSRLVMAVPESCFVGLWRIAESSSFPKAGTLDLHADGSAVVTEFQDMPYSARWKSRDDLLEVTLVSRARPDVDETEPGLTWQLQWKVIERTASQVRLEGPINANWKPGAVTLVRE
ncbi:MAG TPA: hypothetical protein VM510_16390 [Caulifigura sp.]|jgi:hypothetical protein|nr:hypothetical protein [Caulifigura sp.]